MKEYESHVTASYNPAGTEYWNCFKEYINATTATEAKKILKAELKKDGYKKIKMEAIVVN